MARAIETQTAQLPSDTFLWASLGAIGVSLVLQSLGKKEESLFVGNGLPRSSSWGCTIRLSKS
jgi:hypothetical protein